MIRYGAVHTAAAAATEPLGDKRANTYRAEGNLWRSGTFDGWPWSVPAPV